MKLEHTLGIVSFFLIAGSTTQVRFASARTIDIENEQIRLRASNSKSTLVDSGAPLPATTTRTEIRQLQARDGAEVATDTDGGGEEISADESTFDSPTFAPTTAFPTGEAETGVPTELTGDPTRVPTRPPITEAPVTEVPTKSPTDIPTRRVPTEAPETEVPTESPTDIPTRRAPTEAPETEVPTESPTDIPTRRAPTESPSTGSPTVKPSASAAPTQEPSAAPSPKPTPCPVTLGIGNLRCIGSGMTRDRTVSRGSSILAF